jgi:hypothetical protein
MKYGGVKVNICNSFFPQKVKKKIVIYNSSGNNNDDDDNPQEDILF